MQTYPPLLIVGLVRAACEKPRPCADQPHLRDGRARGESGAAQYQEDNAADGNSIVVMNADGTHRAASQRLRPGTAIPRGPLMAAAAP